MLQISYVTVYIYLNKYDYCLTNNIFGKHTNIYRGVVVNKGGGGRLMTLIIYVGGQGDGVIRVLFRHVTVYLSAHLCSVSGR